jgi:hypothetical protein
MRTAPEGRESRLRPELRSLRRAFKMTAQDVETVFQKPAKASPAGGQPPLLQIGVGESLDDRQRNHRLGGKPVALMNGGP